MEYHSSFPTVSLTPGSPSSIFHAPANHSDTSFIMLLPLLSIYSDSQMPITPTLNSFVQSSSSRCYVPPSLCSLTSPRHSTQLGTGRQVKSQVSIHATYIPFLFCSYAFFPNWAHLFSFFLTCKPSLTIMIISCLNNILTGHPVSRFVPISSFTEQPNWFHKI